MRALTLFISIIFMGKMSIKIHKTMQPSAFYEFSLGCHRVHGARLISHCLKFLEETECSHIIHWQQQWQHTMIAATSSFDFQRESHFYLLLSVVCTAHGTNITQNECAFHLCPMWLLHITPPSAHNQKWNRDWDTNWANKCKLQTSNVDVLNRTHRILYIASNKLFTNSIKSDFFSFLLSVIALFA